ncbi:hypothetical protein SUNI508_04897 [Seiridium unicorne]|uniref:Steroid 5-alpha reductase C-terminal domain-containing protein n=1 Tax=Seiridium unicorne TaxID=138068 RepID=A0ABR2V6G5_9PEZI
MTGSGAEQDRFGGWFGGNKADQAKDAAQQSMPKTSGAEQDRYGGWLGGDKADKVQDAVQEHLPKASGAEQDRFGGWFGGGKADQAKDAAQRHLPRTSGAEQDRYEGWLGGDKADKVRDAVQEHLPKTSGAEQDRYGRWLGGGQADQLKDAVRDHLPQTSGAEQDRYGRWFDGRKADQAAHELQEHLPKASGAEQDRYGGWFGSGQADQAKDALKKHLPQTSGAEQDRYEGWLGGDKADQAKDALKKHLPHPTGSGAEQDRYGGWFGGDKLPSRAEVERNLPKGSGAEQDRYGGWFGGDKGPSAQQIRDKLPRGSGAEQDRFGSHFGTGNERYIGTTTLGLLQHTVLPSFGLHAGLGALAYGIGRATDRVEVKDYLWPSGQVVNAWWSAIGIPVVYGGLSISAAWAALTYDQKLLLTGVSAWGLRLFYRVASRSVRRGEDDSRYVAAKKQDPGFWNKALFTLYLPEAAAQTLITLPFVLPFRAPVSSAASSLSLGSSAISHGLAIFLFVAGFTTEVLADYQLAAHAQETGNTSLNRDGVWSIVRHPNYLGDALCHFSFSVLASSAGLLHPLAALGPVVNYVFLRAVGGDKENEASQEARYAKESPLKHQELQEYKRTKNSFWPSLNEVSNKWLWAVVAAGAGGVALEQSLVKEKIDWQAIEDTTGKIQLHCGTDTDTPDGGEQISHSEFLRDYQSVQIHKVIYDGLNEALNSMQSQIDTSFVNTFTPDNFNKLNQVISDFINLLTRVVGQFCCGLQWFGLDDAMDTLEKAVKDGANHKSGCNGSVPDRFKEQNQLDMDSHVAKSICIGYDGKILYVGAVALQPRESINANNYYYKFVKLSATDKLGDSADAWGGFTSNDLAVRHCLQRMEAQWQQEQLYGAEGSKYRRWIGKHGGNLMGSAGVQTPGFLNANVFTWDELSAYYPKK